MKSKLFSILIGFSRALGARGFGNIPGVSAIYRLFFRLLWAKKDVIEVEGSKMYVNLDDEPFLRETLEAYIATPHWDELSTRIFKDVVKTGDVVLDLGANLGYYFLLASRLVGENGKVYSFEPEPRNYRLLTRNIELNGYHNVTALQKAVSNKAEWVKLHISTKDSGAHTIRETVDSEEYKDLIDIEAVKLDDYFSNNSSRIDVVKMDVEGYEPQVFEGMRRIIDDNIGIKMLVEFFPALIREAGYSPEDFISMIINEMKFSILAIDETGKNRRSAHIKNAEELLYFMGEMPIVNLFIERSAK